MVGALIAMSGPGGVQLKQIALIWITASAAAASLHRVIQGRCCRERGGGAVDLFRDGSDAAVRKLDIDAVSGSDAAGRTQRPPMRIPHQREAPCQNSTVGESS